MIKQAPVNHPDQLALCNALIENMFNGYACCQLLFDADGTPEDFIYTSVNSAYMKLTGLADPVGKKVSEVIPGFKESSPDLFEKYCHVAQTGQPEFMEVYVEPLRAWRNIKIFSPEKGFFAVIFENITELKSIRHKQLIMDKVFEHIGEAIVITDADNKIVATNEAFTRLTGYSQEEALGKDPKILKSGREPKSFYQAMWESILRNGYWQGEIWDRRKDGTYYPKLLSISVIRNSDGIITNYIGGFYDVTEQKEAAEIIETLSYSDSLTNLPNRLGFYERFSQILEHAKRYEENLAILFIDLDRFKNINNSLGHPIGDRLLCEVAERLKNIVRAADIVARFGGDEFVIVLTNISDSYFAVNVANKIISAFSAMFVIEGHELSSTPSIGISVFPENGLTAEDLMKNADAAMYHAKSQGRNNYQYFTHEMHNEALERLSMERDLRLALERNEFYLNYQPQVNIASGQLVGVEALVRWKHPVRGTVSPGYFIPLAEEAGLIESIGEWVLRTACKDNKYWQDLGLDPLMMAVNLSARQFVQADICEIIQSALRDSGLDHHYLDVEITESLLVQNVEKVMETLNKLKSSGICLSMDDFGTGYSNLGYLIKFQFDKLKLDQSFVADITTNPDNAAIARAIIALAHNLRLKVIAEGVETEAQLNYLRTLGCDEMQGYFFSRPVPKEGIVEYLRSGYRLDNNFTSEAYSKRTILLVDDEVSVTNSLKRMLDTEGYNVLTAISAEQAFELLANNSISVVISDHRMPIMTGIEFLRKIKDIHPNVVRILMTGFADLEAVTEAVNQGGVLKFISKPWNDDSVKSSVSEAIKYCDFLNRSQ